LLIMADQLRERWEVVGACLGYWYCFNVPPARTRRVVSSCCGAPCHQASNLRHLDNISFPLARMLCLHRAAMVDKLASNFNRTVLFYQALSSFV
jgi:hypothetical protein